MGLKVFPNRKTSWHYDDKIAQKYLLESIGAPLVKSYVFYNEKDAREWIKTTDFPKVFKLRKGAGSSNVKLVRDKREANHLCHIAFSKGFSSVGSYFNDVATKAKHVKDMRSFIKKLKRMPASLRRIKQVKQLSSREVGYIYFQDFIPDNKYDIRVTVVGNIAFGYKRVVRPKDFRASGSGIFNCDPESIPSDCIEKAFNTLNRIGAQSLAFDFISTSGGDSRIIEISYCFGVKGLKECPGYWDCDLNWHYGSILPEDAIIGDLLSSY